MATETAAARRKREAAEATPEPAAENSATESDTPAAPLDLAPVAESDDRLEAAEAAIEELREGQSAIIESQSTQGEVLAGIYDLLQQRQAAEVAAPRPEGTPNPEDVLPRLPDGTVRFRSLRFSEPTYIMEPGYGENVNGRHYIHKARQVDFLHHIADVKDPELIEFMRTHPENGLTFVEDSAAMPVSSGPHVVDGARGTGRTPRDPAAQSATISAAL